MTISSPEDDDDATLHHPFRHRKETPLQPEGSAVGTVARARRRRAQAEAGEGVDAIKPFPQIRVKGTKSS